MRYSIVLSSGPRRNVSGTLAVVDGALVLSDERTGEILTTLAPGQWLSAQHTGSRPPDPEGQDAAGALDWTSREVDA